MTTRIFVTNFGNADRIYKEIDGYLNSIGTQRCCSEREYKAFVRNVLEYSGNKWYLHEAYYQPHTKYSLICLAKNIDDLYQELCIVSADFVREKKDLFSEDKKKIDDLIIIAFLDKKDDEAIESIEEAMKKEFIGCDIVDYRSKEVCHQMSFDGYYANKIIDHLQEEYNSHFYYSSDVSFY